MKRSVVLALLVGAAALAGSGATALGRQTPSRAATVAIPADLVTFNGSVPNQVALHPWELAILPQRTVTVTFQEKGKAVTHTEQGPYLADALTFLGWQPLAACRNDVLRWWIVASNAKGQTALVTRGEIDPGFGNRQAILSISEDGKFLSAKGGPRLIVPGDVTSGRAISNVNQITVGRATSQLAQSGCDDVGKVSSPPPAGSVLINGDVDNPVTLTTAQLQALGLRTMNVSFLNGANLVSASEQGPLLEDVIRFAKPKIRNTCPNDALRFYIQASATDGYSSLLSWGDISSAYGNRSPLLSVNENDIALTGGPRVLAPGDVRGGRYVSGTLILTVIRAKPLVAQRKGC
jgi:hypothetical protein